MKSAYKRSLFFLSLFVLGFIIYSNTLTAPLVFDDHGTIENPRIVNLRNFLHFSGTRYLTDLTFALNYAAGAFNTPGYHLVNILIHITNAVFVYQLVSLMFKTPALLKGKADGEFIAVTSSLLFLTHPVQTEAVTYISQRYASLAAFFYILSIILYLKARIAFDEKEAPSKALAFYAGCVIVTAAAQITKEISFTLPVMITVFEFTFFNNSRAAAALKRLLYLTPVLLSLAIIPAILYLAKAPASSGVAGKLGMLMREDQSILPRYDYLITQFRVIVTYVRLLFIPVGQNADYNYPVFHTLRSPQVLLSFAALSAIFAGAVYLYIRSLGKNPWGQGISFGVIWFFVTISVESSIIPISDVIFEHRLYLPGVGIILSFSTFLAFVSKRIHFRPAAVALLAALVAVNSFATFERNSIWDSEIALWQDVVKKSPNKARGYSNAGYALIKEGRPQEAVNYFGKAVRLKPGFWLTNYNMGNALLLSGRPDESLPFFFKAIKLKPDDADAYANLGYALVELKRPEEAVKYLSECARLKANSADAYNNLGNALLLSGKTVEAISAYRKALELSPNDVGARTNLENSLRLKGSQ